MSILHANAPLHIVNNALWKKEVTYAEVRTKVADKLFTFETRFDTPFLVDKPNGS